jgi:hypothetical protein
LAGGIYVGSGDDTYAHKFLGGSKNRFPANDSARGLQDLWNRGKLRSIDVESLVVKVYAPNANPNQNICDFYQEIQTLRIHAFAEASVSDSPVKMSAEIDCDGSGPSPVFLKSFCVETLEYFRTDQTVFNTKFKFDNILDGFPRSWYIDSADILMRDGLSVVGVKPSQSDVKAFGKYTFNCADL